MYRLLKIFLLSCCAPLCAVAQISPKEGAALNYRIIGFSFPEKQQTTNYKVQVAPGNYTTESSFIKNVAITAAATKNKLIAEVPSFGKQYTWRVGYERGDQITTGELHHFSTLTSPYIDPDSTRMRVTDTAVRYKDNYVFTDGNKVLYDMKGQPVWFLPKMEKLGNNPHLRDLKATPFGTITAIIDLRIYEISYDGTVLWRGPNNSAIDKDAHSFDNAYHHEFTRLANGHYMVMGFEQEWWQLPTVIDSITCAQLPDKIKHDDKNVFYQKMYFSTLTEYDAQGKTIWEWKDGDYFRQSDLYTRMTPNKLFNLNDTHANAFYFDEKTKTITVSFRDINRVIKIRYPDGKVLTTYGTRYPPRDDRNRHLTNGVFCGQHSCRLTDDGQLYLFNNNICHNRSLPSIIVLKEPQAGKDTLEKEWEFTCPMDEVSGNTPTSVIFNFGGNVSEQPDGTFFVCMGGIYGKTFIVNRDKKILWSAQPEKWDNDIHQWSKEGGFTEKNIREGVYRSAIISRAELESLVWNEPLKK